MLNRRRLRPQVLARQASRAARPVRPQCRPAHPILRYTHAGNPLADRYIFQTPNAFTASVLHQTAHQYYDVRVEYQHYLLCNSPLCRVAGSSCRLAACNAATQLRTCACCWLRRCSRCFLSRRLLCSSMPALRLPARLCRTRHQRWSSLPCFCAASAPQLLYGSNTMPGLKPAKTLFCVDDTHWFYCTSLSLCKGVVRGSWRNRDACRQAGAQRAAGCTYKLIRLLAGDQGNMLF